MIDILDSTTSNQLDQVRNIMRAFVDWHREFHQEDLHLIDQYFDAGAFEKELASLLATMPRPKAGSY